MRRNPISVRVKRQELVSGGLKSVEPKIREGSKEGLAAIGVGMLSAAKKRIQKGPKSGRLYRKYGPRRDHRASAPGEAPATDTGGLVNSGFQELDRDGLGVQIGFSKLYAAMLEYGTRLMAKRPFLLPTVEEWRRKIPKIIKAAIQARLK